MLVFFIPPRLSLCECSNLYYIWSARGLLGRFPQWRATLLRILKMKPLITFLFHLKAFTTNPRLAYNGCQWQKANLIVEQIWLQWGKIAASFCQQVAALLPNMFCDFCLVKNHKFPLKNQQPLKVEKIMSTVYEFL